MTQPKTKFHDDVFDSGQATDGDLVATRQRFPPADGNAEQSIKKSELESHRTRLVQEAFLDVDVGLVIDHQAVVEWADSLDTDSPLPPPSVTSTAKTIDR